MRRYDPKPLADAAPLPSRLTRPTCAGAATPVFKLVFILKSPLIGHVWKGSRG